MMVGGTPHPREPIEVDGGIGATLQLFRPDRRRVAVHILHRMHRDASDESAITSLSQLADQVAAVENDCQPVEVERKTRKSAKISLRQNHLPVLNQLGATEWDKRSGSIRTTEGTEHIGLLLIALEESIRTSEIPQLIDGCGWK